MFEDLKQQLWDILKKKEVSLVMIFDRNGDILWHKGREIEGKSIHLGAGFCRSLARRVLANGDALHKENVDMSIFSDGLTDSAKNLSVKSLLILPVKSGFFLYVDSGTKDYFSESDRDVFQAMGQLMGKLIEKVMDFDEEPEIPRLPHSPMKTIREMMVKYALEEEPVLLSGETGVGKSYTAELIHRWSGRKGKFVVAEITSINENLFESTMFGHKKGAFTDARENKTGLVQEADKGTLFIDEISEIPNSFQAKLLRFIEKKKYRVIGDPTERQADVRIVAASNKNLGLAIKEGEFREDLYYRLHVLEIEIPPLRERKEDIKSFITANYSYLKGKSIGDGFWDTVMTHDWPGNMRELITVLKRAGILLDSPITGDKIKAVISGSGYRYGDDKPGINDGPWKTIIWDDIRNGKSFWEVVKEPFLNRDLNRRQVKTILTEALTQTNGNYKETLKILNIKEKQYTSFMKFLYRNHLN